MNKMLRVGGGSADWCNVSAASYDSVSFDFTTQNGIPFDVAFKPDGTKMYMSGGSYGTGSVYQYTLSTAWDVNTASYDSVSLSVDAQESSPTGLEFKPDGTKMYVIGYGSDRIHQYTLSTAWDLNTASYDSVSFSVNAQDNSPRSASFKPDGSKLYVIGPGTKSVYQYTLSTAWDLNTASYDSVSFSVAGQESSPRGLAFKPDGTKMYVVGYGTDEVYQYTLSTAWALNTASYNFVSFSVNAQDYAPGSVIFSTDGTKMYVVGLENDSAYQYTLTC